MFQLGLETEICPPENGMEATTVSHKEENRKEWRKNEWRMNEKDRKDEKEWEVRKRKEWRQDWKRRSERKIGKESEQRKEGR